MKDREEEAEQIHSTQEMLTITEECKQWVTELQKGKKKRAEMRLKWHQIQKK